MLQRWLSYTDVLQPGGSGNVRVEKTTIRCHGWVNPPGSYLQLRIDGQPAMSNTPSQYETNWNH